MLKKKKKEQLRLKRNSNFFFFHICIFIRKECAENHGIVVWVLAGVDLIFFIVTSTGLCFGSVLKAVLITQGWFWHC